MSEAGKGHSTRGRACGGGTKNPLVVCLMVDSTEAREMACCPPPFPPLPPLAVTAGGSPSTSSMNLTLGPDAPLEPGSSPPGFFRMDFGCKGFCLGCEREAERWRPPGTPGRSWELSWREESVGRLAGSGRVWS
ncbi:hypothetical protein HPP92_026257 [Vanilla planifolia]|uniref:Uncharacterized protein n=1 Tax=Vanilla planifolia TaxID=51239 RepID=A0A835PHD5_VANPL|nr:hypothetical protein HPP92_026257 [Vanilla planifolia]